MMKRYQTGNNLDLIKRKAVIIYVSRVEGKLGPRDVVVVMRHGGGSREDRGLERGKEGKC